MVRLTIYLVRDVDTGDAWTREREGEVNLLIQL